MKSENESSSFGRYLQGMRLEKQIGLEQISEETRIAIRNLQAIEKEDLEMLPDEVFVKGFLRAYARAIGADGDEAVRLYQARLNMKAKLASVGSFTPKSSLLLWRNLILSLAAVMAVIVLTLYITPYLQKQTPVHSSGDGRTEDEHDKAAIRQNPPTSSAEKSTPPVSREILALNIRAVEDTWIKVIIDNHDAEEYNLKSGEELKMEAAAGYNLLIGNAGGLKLTFNGEPIKISGKAGEVVNIQLP
jgi:cytoskeleton protein RodZ